MKKKKEPSLFDSEIDALIADFDSTIKEMDRIEKPVKHNFENEHMGRWRNEDIIARKNERPRMERNTDENFFWSRDRIELMIETAPIVERQMGDFYFLLGEAVKFFVWNDFEDGKYLRAWDQQGYSYDPVTAVLKHKYNLHFSMCVTDLAGKYLGLREVDYKELAFVCWNADQNIIENRGLGGLRNELIAVIKQAT